MTDTYSIMRTTKGKHMLTRKDFVELARVVRNVTDNDTFHGDTIDPDSLIDDLSEWCKGQNPRFNAVKFDEACRP